MIAEWLWFDKKTMIEDMAKRAKWESIGFMWTIRVMIFSLLNKVSFLGMTDDWTPEEMKLAGIASSISAGVPKPKEWAKQEIDTVKLENEENMKYRWASTAMRKLLYDKKTERAGIVFEHASFQKMTYGQLESVYREVSPSWKKEWISARLGLTPNTDEVVYEMLTGLCGGKLLSYIKQEYNKKYPQSRIEDISMKSLFVKIANEFGHIVTLRDLDITNPTSFLDGMSFDITADGELTGPVAEKVKSSVSKPILWYMLGDGAENKFTDLKSNLDNAKKRSPTLSEENLIEIEKIFAFGEAFQKKLLGDPKLHLWYADAFKTEFKDPGISFRSLVLLYGSLGGDTAFEQMTALGKLSFYSGVVMVAGGLDSMNRWWVATAFMKKLLGWENPEIDPEVRKLSEDAGVSLIGKAVGWVWETVKTIVGAGKESPMTAVWVVMALWFWWVAKKKWHSYRYH